MKKTFSFIIGLLLFISFNDSAWAKIVFKNEFLLENTGANAWVIDSLDDATGDLVLQFGNTLAETIEWSDANAQFEISDDLNVEGNFSQNGLVFTLDDDNVGVGSNVDIVANQGSDSDGTLRYNATTNEWEASNDGGSFVPVVGDLDDAYNSFGAAASVITVDAAESQTGGLTINGSLAGDETVTISNSGDGGGALIENTGIGDSFRVNDEASDTSPFVIQADGDVGIGTTTPTDLLHVTSGTAGDAVFRLQSDTDNNDETDNPTIILEQDGATQIGRIGLNENAAINYTGALQNAFYLEVEDTTGSDDDFQIATAGAARLTILDSGNVGIGTNGPNSLLDVEGNGEVLEIGDGTAADSFVNFDDGADRNFGWDDSDNAISTFDQQLRFRTIQSATPPVTCAAAVAGMQWMDTDTGITYTCDTSNSRNKWLSINELVIFGDESGSCPAGSDANSNTNCNVDWGNGLGPDGSTNLGFYIPHDMTVTGYGFSEDNDACTSGSFDVEIWGTASNSDDDNYTFEADLATGLTGQAHNSNSSNVDIAGDQYTVWGLDNNCGQGIDDWNTVIYFRYRHD